jgi:hypothetical protein
VSPPNDKLIFQDNVKQLLEVCDNQSRRKVPVDVVREVFNAPTPEIANKILSALPGN